MTPDPAILLDLAERVKAATGPDRELDAQVGRFFAAKFLGYVPDEPATGCALFTASLDAAMMLVPEGHIVSAISQEDTENPQRRWFAELRRGHKTSYDKTLPCWAATPALALTAAALRAIAAKEVK